MISIGIIDTYGFVVAVAALDICLKTADVEFLKATKISAGLMSIIIKGDVSAVNAAIEAGVETAKKMGGYQRHTIIAKADEQIYGVMDFDLPASYHSDVDMTDEVTEKDFDLAISAESATINTEIEQDLESSDHKILDEKRGEPDQGEIAQNEMQQGPESTVLMNINDSEMKIFVSENEAQRIEHLEEISDAGDEINQETEITFVYEKPDSVISGFSHSEEELKMMTVSKLKKLAHRLDVKNVDNKKIRTMRKSELIEYILYN